MKFLLLLAVLVIAYVIWRNARIQRSRDDDAARAAKPRPPGAPQEMITCARCAVHLPRGDAVEGSGGALYCSQEHRLLSGD